MNDPEDIKANVRERYAGFAAAGTSCCGPATSECGCGSAQLGYDPAELAELPEGADLGLGCGNPLAFTRLREGDVVVDLGSGGGIDCLLAAKRVGASGRVIGVDMTPGMIERATDAAARGGFDNVEFRLGELESLPVDPCTADVVISNCVINLVPDKAAAFAEAHRVLKAGGRLEVSDIVLTGPMPEWLANDPVAYSACLAGAIHKQDYLAALFAAGFAWVGVADERPYAADVSDAIVQAAAQATGRSTEELMAAAGVFSSIQVSAIKGDGGGC